MAAPTTYIWKHAKWPEMSFDHQVAGPAIAAVRRSQGEMERKAGAIVLDRVLEKCRFRASHATIDLNERQRKVLQRLLDEGDGGVLGGLNADKYMTMTAVSKATATRDLGHMLAQRLLWTQGQGKGLRYFINVPGWAHGAQAKPDSPT